MEKFQPAGLVGRLGGGIGVTFPTSEADEPAIRHRLGLREEALIARGVGIIFVGKLVPVWYDFAHVLARKLERARERFLAVLRQRRDDRRKQTWWLDRFRFVR